MTLHPFLKTGIPFLASLLATVSFAENCPTHLTCPINTDCVCTVPPSSAFNKNFYTDFPAAIKKNQAYRCSVKTDGRMGVTFLRDQSTYPTGSRITQCTDGCSFSPVTFQLDTSKMVQSEATLVIKYNTPASDIPQEVHVRCDAQ